METFSKVIVIMGLFGLLSGCKSEADRPDKFEMIVADVFYINANGGFHALTGIVKSGTVAIGDTVYISRKKYTVADLETLSKKLTTAKTGDNIALSIKGQEKNTFKQGDIITTEVPK